MSIFGKVLIILNILVAGVFIYLSTADWSQRETWSYAVYRQELALDGLPLDEQELDAEGRLATDRLTEQTLKAIFQPVGETLPSPLRPEDKTQLGAVQRLRDRLRGEINSLGGDEPKIRAQMVAWLVPLARTGGERDGLRQFLNMAPFDKVIADNGPFELVFKRVLEPGSGELEEAAKTYGREWGFQDLLKPIDKDPQTRRQEVAHLLLNMTADPTSQDFARQYQRVLVIVGLKAFASQADQQYYALRDMAERLTLAMSEDRATFERDYDVKLKYLYGLAEDLGLSQKKLAEYEKLTRRHQDLVKARQADFMDLTTKLESARQATKTALANLTTEQQRLFEAERHVATAAAKNQQLEREIRVLEKGKP
jgi:hypothetical protein